MRDGDGFSPSASSVGLAAPEVADFRSTAFVLEFRRLPLEEQYECFNALPEGNARSLLQWLSGDEIRALQGENERSLAILRAMIEVREKRLAHIRAQLTASGLLAGSRLLLGLDGGSGTQPKEQR